MGMRVEGAGSGAAAAAWKQQTAAPAAAPAATSAKPAASPQAPADMQSTAKGSSFSIKA